MSERIAYENVIRIPEGGLIPPDGTGETISSRMRDRIDCILIPEERIRERVSALAEQICRDYAVKKELNFVVILKGALVFASDLGREIYKHNGPEVKYHFIRSHTYGKQIKQNGEARREAKIEFVPRGIRGKDVLLLDDMLDQGFTLSKVKQCLIEHGAGSLKVCTLLNKRLKEPSEEAKRSREGLILDYVGFEIPDKWVAGYGIDAGEDFRHLPFVVAVRDDYYLNRG